MESNQPEGWEVKRPKEGMEVVETEKGQRLFVVSVSAERIGMAYSQGGTESVRASREDFAIFFEPAKPTKGSVEP